jgi:hypothetical protein
MTGRRITFVKKVLANGEPCGKCRDVEARLTAGDNWGSIDQVVVADERDPDSPGMQIAAELGVDRAPFFVVENGGTTAIYTVFLKFQKEVLGRSSDTNDAQILLASNPELDFL